MKNKATGFLKRVISMLTSMARAKTLALKSKTNALRTRLIIFSLVRDKKILMPTSISQKLHGLLGHHHKNKVEEEEEEEEEVRDLVDQSNGTIVVYNQNTMSLHSNPTHPQLFLEGSIEEDDNDDNLMYGYGHVNDDEEEEEKYPDLRHTLFESGLKDPGGSVIEMVKNSKEEAGEEFRLEDEIDQVADLFIKRFHHQIRLQKQLSLKRHHQEMLQRGA